MSVYGKLINNTLTLAPRRLTIDECVVFNPTDAQYEAAGYLPVIYTPAPEAPERLLCRAALGRAGRRYR